MKNFDEKEFNCAGIPCFDKMDKVLLQKLDEAREIAKVPFQINSSWRSEGHNERVGGSATSSHLYGLAVDIACSESRGRWRIVQSLIKVGFKRIGIAEDFIHVDIDETKEQHLIWVY